MRIDTPQPRRLLAPAAVRVSVELSTRGEKMLAILNDLFNGIETDAAESSMTEAESAQDSQSDDQP